MFFNKLRRTVLILFVITPCAMLNGQSVVFDRLTVDDGLSQSSIFAIVQDSLGFMWFGTEDGLNRYDGYEFMVFRPDAHTNSVSDNYITVLTVDHQGYVWIGTNNNGICKFDPLTGRFEYFIYDPAEASSPSEIHVRSIAVDSQGIVWAGTLGDGLYRIVSSSGEVRHFTHNPDDHKSIPSNKIETLYLDSENILWIGLPGKGLARLNPEEDTFIHYPVSKNSSKAISNGHIHDFTEDGYGNLWIATERGVNIFDRRKETFTQLKHDPTCNSLASNIVHSLLYDDNGNIWIGTNGGGLDKYIISERKFIHHRYSEYDPFSLVNNRVWSLFQDRTGIIWAGTNGGICKFNEGNRQFSHVKPIPGNPVSLSGSRVRCFAEESDSIIWVGTWDGGLNRFNRLNNSAVQFKNKPGDASSLPSDIVKALLIDTQNRLWVGTQSGLCRFERRKRSFVQFDLDKSNPDSYQGGGVRALIEDDKGRIWIGSENNGVEVLANGKFRRNKCLPEDESSLSSNQIRSLMAGSNGMIWVGTANGLNRINPRTKSIRRLIGDYPDADFLKNSHISSLLEDKEGHIWIATMGRGLFKFHPKTGEFKQYNRHQGLANDVIYGVLPDEAGMLWLSTNKGISRFDPKNEVFYNVPLSKGLQSYEYNGGAYHKGKSGYLYFGGINGFNYFLPENIKNDTHPPNPVITAFQNLSLPSEIMSSETDGLHSQYCSFIDTTLRLSYKDRVLQFEFSALHFYNTDNNSYAYRLTGFNNDWIYSGHRRYATFTNLPSGSYTLELKAANFDGVWSEESFKLPLIITPPIYDTLIFRIFFVCVIVFSILGLHKYRVRSLNRRRGELQKLVELRTEELDRKAGELETRVIDRTKELEETNQKLIEEITDKVRVSDELDTTEKRYRFVFDAAIDGFLLMDRDIFIDCNQSVLDQFSCDRDDLIGRTPYFFSPDIQPDGTNSKEKALKFIDEALAGKPQSFEWIHNKKSGEFFNAEINLKRIEINEEFFLFAIVRDITARRKSENALRESERKYRLVVDNSLEGIYITQNHVLKFCNQKFAEMFGFSNPVEALGTNLKNMVSSGSWDIVDQKVKDRESGKTQVEHYYFTAKRKDGFEFEVETLGSAIDYEGKPAIHGVMRDVSEQRSLEQQLRQSQKMEDVGRLAGGIAHDFNNMLTAIIGHNDLAKMDLSEDDPLMEYLEEIGKGAARAADLTRKLLAFSRQQTLSPKVATMNDIITDIYKMLRRIIGEHIQLYTLPSEEDWLVEIDPGQMEHSLVNLAINARDAMPEGGKLRIEVRNSAIEHPQKAVLDDIKPNDYVVLSVSDTGTGMPEEISSKIFEPFFTTKPEGRGTGLGLSTVYGIVKQSGGYIQVESKVGKGTTFNIFVPRQLEKAKSLLARKRKYELPRGDETVLLVEDDSSLRDTAVKILQRQGYQVIEAKSGVDAMLICKGMEKPVDLVITDVVMPVMGGIEMASELQKLWNGVKILFMSGYSDDHLFHESVYKGEIEYLPKPFDPLSLTRKIREVLDKPS